MPLIGTQPGPRRSRCRRTRIAPATATGALLGMGTATTVAWAVATVYARPDPDGSNAAGTDQTLPVVQSGGEGGIRTLGQLSLTPVFKSHNSPSQLSSALSNTSVIGTRKREDWPLFAENPTTVPKERRLDSLDPKSCTPYSAWPPTIVCAERPRLGRLALERRSMIVEMFRPPHRSHPLTKKK